MAGLRRYPRRRDQTCYVLVINNMNFYGNALTTREGSDKDVKSIQDLFRGDGYTINVKQDRTLAQMVADFRSCRTTLQSGDHHQFICFILSHGGRAGIVTRDGNVMTPEAIETIFNGVNLEEMLELPKVFVFQACRGGDRQPAVLGGGGRVGRGGRGGGYFMEGGGATLVLPVFVPTEANILMAYATMAGKVSFRSPSNGSLFIQSLCKVFKDHHRGHDVLSMLTEVIRDVSTTGNTNMAQLPVVVTKLTKKMYLK